MERILEELYNHFPPHRVPDSADKKAVRTEYHAMCRRIQEAFGLEFVDRFVLCRAELEYDDELSMFRRGFQLGVQIMTEVFEDS